MIAALSARKRKELNWFKKFYDRMMETGDSTTPFVTYLREDGQVVTVTPSGQEIVEEEEE